MDADDLVRNHYSRDGLVAAVLEALARDGVDRSAVDHEVLAPIDNLHAGFLPATLDVVARLELDQGSTLLDVGSGVGGPARVAAATTGGRVVGVDLSPDFVATARELTDLVGLGDRVRFETCTATRLPFDDDTFDAAMMIHVGMNLADKSAVFSEVARTLRPGARFVVYDQMRVGPGEPTYPLPWASDERSSFVEAPEQYVDALVTAGFVVDEVVDRTAEVTGPPTSGTPSLNPGVLFGEGFGESIGNNVAAALAGILGAVVVAAHVA